MAMGRRATEHPTVTRHKEDNQIKAKKTFLTKMITKLEMTLYTTYQHKDNTQDLNKQ